MGKSHSLNIHAQFSSGTRGLRFGLSRHRRPHFACANSKGVKYHELAQIYGAYDMPIAVETS